MLADDAARSRAREVPSPALYCRCRTPCGRGRAPRQSRSDPQWGARCRIVGFHSGTSRTARWPSSSLFSTTFTSARPGYSESGSACPLRKRAAQAVTHSELRSPYDRTFPSRARSSRRWLSRQPRGTMRLRCTIEFNWRERVATLFEGMQDLVAHVRSMAASETLKWAALGRQFPSKAGTSNIALRKVVAEMSQLDG